ncbi:DUF4192 domain-containing protein [Nocardioides plantarum]|uniref:DUF4192 domain-containing protein n=1 Tax=Nocardioides plantarum TaxID=29299 RepID=A0ABV5KDJ9_9ACTN|nr:DUF4192 domain-containing protein [Nocardioides plantarum]
MTNSTNPPTPPTRLTARSPEDLLAAAAVVLGFWPTESVVMLTFDAAHPFHARVDLPVDPDAMPELAATLAAPAVHHRVGRVVLLLYSADADRVQAAWRALRAALRRHRITVVEALAVGDDRWRSLLATSDRAGEDEPEAVPFDPVRLAAHPFLAQAVLDGRVLHRSRDDLATSLEPDAAAVARVERAVAGLATRPGALDAPSAQLAEGTWAQALVARHLAATSPAPAAAPSDADVARLLCSMQVLRVRDAAWSAITRARARPAVAFFADVLRRSPRELRPAAAALLAWAAWQSGDGALAWCALDRCDDVDPAYGLSALIAEALERAVPPSVMVDGFDWREGLEGLETG